MKYILVVIALLLVPVPAEARCFLFFCWPAHHVRHYHHRHHHARVIVKTVTKTVVKKVIVKPHRPLVW